MYYIAKTTAAIHVATVAIHDAVHRATMATCSAANKLHQKVRVSAGNRIVDAMTRSDMKHMEGIDKINAEHALNATRKTESIEAAHRVYQHNRSALYMDELELDNRLREREAKLASKLSKINAL